MTGVFDEKTRLKVCFDLIEFSTRRACPSKGCDDFVAKTKIATIITNFNLMLFILGNGIIRYCKNFNNYYSCLSFSYPGIGYLLILIFNFTNITVTLELHPSSNNKYTKRVSYVFLSALFVRVECRRVEYVGGAGGGGTGTGTRI